MCDREGEVKADRQSLTIAGKDMPAGPDASAQVNVWRDLTRRRTPP
jgi:hypothetical protein